jgi:uncharacterized protein with PQ loop repeat
MPPEQPVASALGQLVGWFPAVLFPLASLLQLRAIVARRSAAGVSVASWAMFAMANVSLYLYMERFTEPQAMLSGLGTAAANLAVVAAALWYRNERRPPTGAA